MVSVERVGRRIVRSDARFMNSWDYCLSVGFGGSAFGTLRSRVQIPPPRPAKMLVLTVSSNRRSPACFAPAWHAHRLPRSCGSYQPHPAAVLPA